MTDTPTTPDLAAIRANAEGLTAVYRTHRQHHSAVRAAEVMAEGWATDPTATVERLAGALGVAIWQLTEAHDELARLRPMETALAAARALHVPTRINDDGMWITVCRHCCTGWGSHGLAQLDECDWNHRHGTGQPICATRAALDGGASDGE